MPKKILVTGGAGYIGSRLVPSLLAKGYEVRVLDRMIFGDFGIKDVLGKIELVQGDIRTVDASVCKDIDTVIHLAGYSTEPTAQFNPRETDLVNHIGTERMARMAKEQGVKKFLFASSASVYFTYDTPLDPPSYKESDKVNSISPYSLSKRAGEEVLLELADEHFTPIIFRKGTIYGWAPKMRFDLVLNSFTKDAFMKKRLTVSAGGQVWRPMLHIQDAIDMYLKAIEIAPEKLQGNHIFNVCSENWNLGEMAQKVWSYLKEQKGVNVEIEILPVGITRNYKQDNALSVKVFDFAPTYDIEKGVGEVWEKVVNMSFEELKNPIYYTDVWYQKVAHSLEKMSAPVRFS